MCDYTVNPKNADTTVQFGTGKWSITDMYNTPFTLDELVKTLETINTFKEKYPNDDTIQNFEEIVRDEICQMFGGTVLDNE
jgi:hypothetical protein